MNTPQRSESLEFNIFNAPGEMAQRCRDFDWAGGQLGPVKNWDSNLRFTTNLILQSAFPCFLLWGNDRILIYNDPYIKMLGRKHPQALGQPFLETWSEVRSQLAPIIDEVFKGKAHYQEDLELTLDRFGLPAEAYFTFSYSPIQKVSGEVNGLFCCAIETTEAVISKQENERSKLELTNVLEGMTEGFSTIDKNWIVTRLNDNHEIFTQKKREEQIGQTLIDLFFAAPEYKESIYIKSYTKAMVERVPVYFEDYYKPLDLWTRVSVYPQPDGGLAVFFKKINEEKKSQQDLINAKTKPSVRTI